MLTGLEGETEEEFAQEVTELVAEEAPRLFALVQEYGERADGRVIAWGMAFDDYAEAVSVGRRRRGTFPSAERTRQAFARRAKIRLVWTDAKTTFPVATMTLLLGTSRSRSLKRDLIMADFADAGRGAPTTAATCSPATSRNYR